MVMIKQTIAIVMFLVAVVLIADIGYYVATGESLVVTKDSENKLHIKWDWTMHVICITSGTDEILEDLSDKQAVLRLLERLIYDHNLSDFTVKVKQMDTSDFQALADIPEFTNTSLVNEL